MNALAKTHPPFTSAEFHRMAAKGAFGDMRVELRRGIILKMSPQHIPHALTKDELQERLKLAVKAAGLKWKVLSEVSVSFGSGFEPMPDIVVLDMDQLSVKDGPVPAAAVKLVVEVSDSTLADDMGEKREDYVRAGLAEYWVADVQGKTVIRHSQPSATGYSNESAPVSISQPLVMLTQPKVVAKL